MQPPEKFEALARRAMAEAVAYRGSHHPPRPTVGLEELQTRFHVPLPEQGRPGEEVLADLAAAAEGGLTATTQPNFYAWVMGSSHPVGVAAEWLVTSWGQNAGTYDSKKRPRSTHHRVNDRICPFGIGPGLQQLVNHVDKPDRCEDRPHMRLRPRHDEEREWRGHETV